MSTTRISIGFALVLLAIGGLAALAQEELTSDEEVQINRTANLSAEEMRAEGAAVVQRGEDLGRRVLSQLDEARQERDIVRVTCVNDKLTQINATTGTARDRNEALEDAIDAADNGRAAHEFTVLIVLKQKLVVLDREAAQCIGQEIYETGATLVRTEIDPETPEDDPTALPEVPPIVVIIPPPAS